jgi:putative ABC transport system substrate-binding protein
MIEIGPVLPQPPRKEPFVLLGQRCQQLPCEPTVRDVEGAARAMGLQIRMLHANTSREIDAAFATFVHDRPDALFVGPSAFCSPPRIPVVKMSKAGGLMSYGASVIDAHRQMGVYAGRVLKGAKPADLPVTQATKFELVINLQTARILGLEVPPSLLARADEVIE